ncbi:oxygen-regulated protein 1-like protein [Anopheles sinensis]|uniref:Oxygen-regulated protein 1-like protein n=1 Tax=Anopheles sinensis TaxID=74873 RepID=A0A084WM07_ANOSI|nr:oxygen-regulated protein 1-like protein [Anopheles sinensis]
MEAPQVNDGHLFGEESLFAIPCSFDLPISGEYRCRCSEGEKRMVFPWDGEKKTRRQAAMDNGGNGRMGWGLGGGKEGGKLLSILPAKVSKRQSVLAPKRSNGTMPACETFMNL